jgi:hypothetical protein
MNAKQYLNVALGGNMNISTLKPLAWHEIMESYAQHKLAEALKPSHDYAAALKVHRAYCRAGWRAKDLSFVEWVKERLKASKG